MIAYAAIRYPNGDVYKARRHYLCIQQAKDSGRHERTEQFEDGFITDTGEFISDRNEAAKIARRCGQVGRYQHKGPLYSEDVWPDLQPATEAAA